MCHLGISHTLMSVDNFNKNCVQNFWHSSQKYFKTMSNLRQNTSVDLNDKQIKTMRNDRTRKVFVLFCFRNLLPKLTFTTAKLLKRQKKYSRSRLLLQLSFLRGWTRVVLTFNVDNCFASVIRRLVSNLMQFSRDLFDFLVEVLFQLT